MATITVTNTIDVADKYETLVQQSLGGNSVYIRAKETIEDLFSSGSMSDSEKGQVISSVVGNIVSTITTSSMATALEWAKFEKQVELDKLKLVWELDTLEQQSLLVEAQVEQTNIGNRLAKVESKRMYGTAVFDVDGNIVSLADEGKVFADIALTDANTSKTVQEEALTIQKIKESYAAVHKIVADTYVNYGNYTWSYLANDGMSGIAPQHGAFVTLSNTQQEIAVEQAKGYTYNAWANALTGSASMLGTAIAAEYAQFEPGTTGGNLLDIMLDTAYSLQQATTIATEATPQEHPEPAP